MSRGQIHLDYAMARNSLMSMNYFVKSNEQRTSLLGLCHGKAVPIVLYKGNQKW